MNQVERLLHEAHLRYQRQQLKPDSLRDDNVVGASHGELFPRVELKGVKMREPQSRTWQAHHRDYKPAGFYRIHCSHDKLLWDCCTQCHRDKREATRNFGKLARGDRF